MLFNSLEFTVFLPIVFIAYWFIMRKSLKAQNLLLLAASFFFYGCWDWRFLFLLLFSILLDFCSGIQMSQVRSRAQRKFWFWLSIGINLGFLGTFKYYNFFAESFTHFLSGFGWKVHPATISVILPVGISFYTFHGLSYVIDIYNGKIKAERNFIDYAVFVSFFPLLVAGPIERATHLLPQIRKPRTFDYGKAVDGLKQILWGLVKKVVIADQCAEWANIIFNNAGDYSGSTLVLGALFFSFQIYGDFSGYSDIALGTARLFGIELLRNFSFPYFSRDIAEFWRRWHISLSSWFKDYLYIPLGGSKGGTWKSVRNTLIIFLVSGFWHGANWTFIVWGLLNAVYIIPSILLHTNRSHLEIIARGRLLPGIKELLQMMTTFILTAFAWIFFRADSLGSAFSFIRNIFSSSLFIKPSIIEPGTGNPVLPLFLLLLVGIFMLVEWLGREGKYAIEHLSILRYAPARLAFYYLLVIALFWFGGKEQQFIYFQF